MAMKRARSNSLQSAEMVSSGYERSREERIKENLHRMQKLGILNLALKLKSENPSNKTKPITRRKKHFSDSPLPPTRRSSRLQNATPVSYCEVKVSKKDESLENGDNLLSLEGFRPEVYTEEHEKLLGTTEESWTFFVDGYGKDGKRIYDSANGKTCHQCRQKTLGHRTCCSKCEMVQGQFCGDCLYMRYGEHVLEAKENPNWVCPPCRGICNCSLCRQAKGWPATGSLYRKISALGYKSVAHYLIQTRKENAESDNIKTKVPLSAKRSLPFVETETTFTDMDTSESNHNPQELENYNSGETKSQKNFNEDIGEKAHDALSHSQTISENKIEFVVKPEIAFEAPEDCPLGPEMRGAKHEVEATKEKEVDMSVEKDSSNVDGTTVLDENKLQNHEASKENNHHSDELVASDGIVGSVRFLPEEEEVIGDNTKPPRVVPSLNALHEVKEAEIGKSPISKKKHDRATDPVIDSIGMRLRQRRSQNKLS